jgi:hypothetical protein
MKSLYFDQNRTDTFRTQEWLMKFHLQRRSYVVFLNGTQICVHGDIIPNHQRGCPDAGVVHWHWECRQHIRTLLSLVSGIRCMLCDSAVQFKSNR